MTNDPKDIALETYRQRLDAFINVFPNISHLLQSGGGSSGQNPLNAAVLGAAAISNSSAVAVQIAWQYFYEAQGLRTYMERVGWQDQVEKAFRYEQEALSQLSGRRHSRD